MSRFNKEFKNTVDLVSHFEGFRARAYRDPVNVKTVGYGWAYPDVEDSHHVPESMARAAMSYHLNELYNQLRYDLDYSGLLGKPSDRALLAFTDLAYNVGINGVLPYAAWDNLKRGNWPEACARFLLYNKAGGRRLPGLVRRRMVAHVLHFQGTLSFYPSPSDIHPQVSESLKQLTGNLDDLKY